MASIKDIAIEVGVSAAAVSYVLNNTQGKESKVSKEIAQKIRNVARRLNYQPNYIARSLKSGITHTIGLIVEDISNPFFSNLASIIEKQAQAEGYTVIIGCHYEDEAKCEKLLQALLLRQVDGIILTPVDKSEKQIRTLSKTGKPFVLVDRYFSGILSNTVTINNFDISRQAVAHLLAQGYRRISMVAYDTSLEHMNDRIRGYQQALTDAGIKDTHKNLVKVSFPFVEKELEASVRKLLKRKDRPDSIFFVNNIIAIKSLEVINESDLRVPEQLGLVSFDSRDAFNFFYSPLSYIEQNLKEVGERTVEVLLNAMRNKVTQPTNVVVDARLVVRQSSTPVKH